jgi:hypothetical protein
MTSTTIFLQSGPMTSPLISPARLLARALDLAETCGYRVLAKNILPRIGAVSDGEVPMHDAFFQAVDAIPWSYPPGGSCCAIVVDPGMVSCGGHHYQFNSFLIEMLESSKIGLQILSGNSDCVRSTRFSGYFTNVFTVNLYDHDDDIQTCEDAIAMNLLFWLEIAQARIVGSTLFICHSLRVTNALFYAALARRYPTAGFFGNVIEFDHLEPDHPHHRLADVVYEQFFCALEFAGPRHLILCCEVRCGADYLNAIATRCGSAIRVAQSSYLPAAWSSRKYACKAAKPWTGRCFGFVGGTRSSRGAGILPEIVVGSCVRQPDIKWIVQYDCGYLKANIDQQFVRAWDALVETGQLIIYPTGLDTVDYCELLNRIDVLVLPYDIRYESSGSGVFYEALSFGKVILCPERSTLSEYLAAAGIIFPCFDSNDLETILTAIDQVTGEFGDYVSAHTCLAEQKAAFDRHLYSFAAIVDEFSRSSPSGGDV